MSDELLPPHQVVYRLSRIFLKDGCKNKSWPAVAGIAAKHIGAEYEHDYRRCQDICRMIREDEEKLREEAKEIRVPQG
jgi:hypothetical protein